MSASLIILLSKIAVKGVYGDSVSTDFSDIDKFLREFSIKDSLAEAPANLYYGYIAVGGKIFLMKDRIEFHPHNVLQRYKPVILKFDSIEKTQLSRQFLFVPNCFSILNRDGVEYKFVASYRRLWVESIEFMVNKIKS
jgi:hypothetical protein